MALARPLGADVPVFIYGRPAFAQGIGNILSPVDLPERAYLVVHPPQHVQTADVFSSPDLTRNTACVKISVFADWQKINAPNNGFYKNGLFGSNDLEPVVRSEEHTSELQSLMRISYAFFCLKKKINMTHEQTKL